jgi:hypothetical protein
MNAAGTRVLFVPDALARGGGNLAVIDLDAPDPGDAPLVRVLHLDPDTVPLDGSTSATITTEISWEHRLAGAGVWLEVRRDEALDPIFGSSVVPLLQGPERDPQREQGIFTADLAPSETGGALGPRHLRLIIESQAADGRRRGTVLELDKTLTVGESATSERGVYRGNASGLTIDTGSATTPGQLVIGSVAAEIILEPSIGGNFKVVGRSLSYEAERVSATGRQKESFKSSSGAGDLYGAWGLIRFEGQLTTQSEQNGLQTFEYWTMDFRLVRDSDGHLVLCPHRTDLGLDEQAANAHCLTTAMVVLQPVADDSSPPVT